MNTDLHQAAEQYVGVINGEMVCHTGIIQMPMKKGKKRVHRLVVLPDYQGVGIGTKFIKEVAKHIDAKGYELNLTTTTPALVGALKKDPEWILARYGRVKQDFTSFEKSYGLLSKKNSHHLLAVKSNNRITYSFWYKPKGGGA